MLAYPVLSLQQGHGIKNTLLSRRCTCTGNNSASVHMNNASTASISTIHRLVKSVDSRISFRVATGFTCFCWAVFIALEPLRSACQLAGATLHRTCRNCRANVSSRLASVFLTSFLQCCRISVHHDVSALELFDRVRTGRKQ